jgi:predicted regulator of Ras-like GTPase activity (Roadblock/LC7/MglB family)
MKMLKDCSEVKEARDLLLRIMAPASRAPVVGPAAAAELAPPEPHAVPPPPPLPPPLPPAAAPASPPPWTPPAAEPSADTPLAIEVESLVSGPEVPVAEEPVPAPAPVAVPPPVPAAPAEYVSASRGERLHAVLSTLCDSEGYAGAMVTDASGLPLATSRNLEASDSLAAFSTVLGDVLTKAGSYLGHDDASHVTLDVGERQKVVLRRFYLEERAFYLVVICLRVLETHRALDRTVPRIVLTLSGS